MLSIELELVIDTFERSEWSFDSRLYKLQQFKMHYWPMDLRTLVHLPSSRGHLPFNFESNRGSSTTFLLDGEIIYWKPYRNCKRWPKNVQIDRGGVSSLLHCYIPISEQPAFPASTQTHTRQSKGKQKYHRKINNDTIAQKFTIKFRLRNTRAHCWSKKEMQAHDIYTRMKCEMVRSLTLDPMALVFVWAQRNK